MPRTKTMTTEDRELGKMLAERAGLDPSKVLEDWDVQSFDEEVMFTFQVVSKMPRAEWEAIAAAIEGDASVERKMTPAEIEEWRRTCPYPEALGQ